MELVVDANVIFSALIKDSFNCNLLFSDKLTIYSPDYLLIELEKHKSEILAKTSRSNDEFNELIKVLRRRINFVALEELVPYLEKAERFCPDPDDVAYFALAIMLNCSIWSNDKALKEKQNVITVYSIYDLVQIMI